LDSVFLTLLSDAGIASAVVVGLMIAGVLIPKWVHDQAKDDIAKRDATIANLQDALDLERQRSNDANQAGLVTNQLIGGLLRLAEHGNDDKAPPVPRAALDLTGKDIGL